MDLFESLNSYPHVTRAYLIISFISYFFCFAKLINGISLCINFELVLKHFNFWRLFSHLFYFGEPGILSFSYIFFFARYSSALEKINFQGRRLEYLYLLLTGNSLLLLMKLFVKEATFLGPGITFMVVTIWSKKNAQSQINLFNLITIKGSHLPLVLLFFNWLMRQKTIKLDIMGMIAGHIYFYLEEIYPRMNGGQKVFPSENHLKKLVPFNYLKLQ